MVPFNLVKGTRFGYVQMSFPQPRFLKNSLAQQRKNSQCAEHSHAAAGVTCCFGSKGKHQPNALGYTYSQEQGWYPSSS